MAHFRQQQSQEQTTTYVTNDTGVSFRDGVMHVDGRPLRPLRVESWFSSNGYTTYQTVEWEDPVTMERRTSCNCPGWAHKRGSRRECVHTKDMEGIKPCTRDKANTHVIRTVADAVAHVPDMRDGRALRGIMLD